MKYHLIAVGGTGMGALAGLLSAKGYEVRGSDRTIYPPMSEQLAALEIPVFQGFSAENLSWGPDVVVVGNVCSKDHVEVLEAQRREIPLTSLPALLGEEFLAEHHSMVVTGTHGKTTTSSLLGHILQDAGRDPGVFVGGVSINLGRGWRLGQGPEFVVEGDEYDSAFFDKGPKFLHYRPRTAILTSVELDHVDIFSTMEEVRRAFREFVALIPEDGLLLVSHASDEARAIARESARARVETYAVDEDRQELEVDALVGEDDEVDAGADAAARPTWVALDVRYRKSGRCRYKVYRNGRLLGRFESSLIGRHNVCNSLAAIAAAYSVGVEVDVIRKGLASFAGVKRRQEVCGIAQGVYVIDDYAHHPTAVEETLHALGKRFQGRRLIAVFEPRSATSRRKTFQREYARALAHADTVIVGRLHDPSAIPPEDRLDPEKLALEIHNTGTPASYVEKVSDVTSRLESLVRPGDVVVILSSGAFDGLHRALLTALGDAVHPAGTSDMRDIRALASELGWSHEQLGDDQAGNFLVLENETGFVGCVALDVYGEAAILRSLAVKEGARGVGYGWLLADTVVQMARHRGVKRIYLLTHDASDFFAAKLGFRVVEMSTVSTAVANSATFRAQGAGQGGAVAMRLDL